MNMTTETYLPPISKVFVGYSLSSRFFDRSCEDKLERAMVKNLCQENYQTAATAAIGFPPFPREFLKAVPQRVKKEVRTYCKGKSMAKYEGDPLKLNNFNGEEFFGRSERANSFTHSIVTMTSKDGVQFLANKQVLALSARPQNEAVAKLR